MRTLQEKFLEMSPEELREREAHKRVQKLRCKAASKENKKATARWAVAQDIL